MTLYKGEFYKDRHQATLYAARTVLGVALRGLQIPKTAVDVGCGVGTWLSVLQEYGVQKIQGLDGPWVNPDHLEISASDYLAFDFNAGVVPSLNQKFDLAICLEVAEHISATKADQFIEFLTTLSDQVLFSAAIPGQGGIGHVNERWPTFWIELFGEHGYQVTDSLRPAIWSDSSIPFWYRQNIMLFHRIPLPGVINNGRPDFAGMSIVHPELFNQQTAPKYVRESFLGLFAAIRRAIKRRIASHSYPAAQD